MLSFSYTTYFDKPFRSNPSQFLIMFCVIQTHTYTPKLHTNKKTKTTNSLLQTVGRTKRSGRCLNFLFVLYLKVETIENTKSQFTTNSR